LARYPDAYDTGTRGTYCGSADTTRASSVAVRALTWAEDVVRRWSRRASAPRTGAASGQLFGRLARDGLEAEAAAMLGQALEEDGPALPAATGHHPQRRSVAGVGGELGTSLPLPLAVEQHRWRVTSEL